MRTSYIIGFTGYLSCSPGLLPKYNAASLHVVGAAGLHIEANVDPGSPRFSRDGPNERYKEFSVFTTVFAVHATAREIELSG